MQTILFGTYTKRVSQGIYSAQFDAQTGALSDEALVAEVGSPTYLTVSEAGKLYSVAKDGAQGGVAVYDYQNGSAELMQTLLTEGASPAYIAVDEPRQLVYTGNYHRGTVDVYRIEADGTLTHTDQYQSEGDGPRPEQGSSHIHYTNVTDTDEHRLVAVDLGADKLLTFDVTDAGKLHLVSTFKFEPGFGPRHLRFSKNGKYAYVLGELSSQLAVLRYDANYGTYEMMHTVSTIPADWTEHNGAAAIYVSENGRFVYTSNRGHNSIAVFGMGFTEDKAELLQLASTEGVFPRDFALSPDEKYLVAANQDSDNVTVFTRDEKTGLLTEQSHDFNVPEANRVLFVD